MFGTAYSGLGGAAATGGKVDPRKVAALQPSTGLRAPQGGGRGRPPRIQPRQPGQPGPGGMPIRPSQRMLRPQRPPQAMPARRLPARPMPQARPPVQPAPMSYRPSAALGFRR